MFVCVDLFFCATDCVCACVDSDFASDMDTRKSMTGYLMSLNGGPISWKSSRQGGVTLSSCEAEFVAASQAGQEPGYLFASFVKRIRILPDQANRDLGG